MKTQEEVYSSLSQLLSPARVEEQSIVDSDRGRCFDLDPNTKEAYRVGACYTIQAIRQELIAGELISNRLAAELDVIQWRLQ